MLHIGTDNETTDDPNVIPHAQWFVVATDTFLSNWKGTPSEGRANYVVIPVWPGQNDARIMDNLSRRSDMARVRLADYKSVRRYAFRDDVLASIYGIPERPVPEAWLEGA